VRVHDAAEPRASRTNPLLLLVLGIAIGVALDPGAWWDAARQQLAGTPKARVQPVDAPVPGAGATGLPTLAFEIDSEAAEQLARVRQRAVSRNLIVQEGDETVPARVRFEGRDLDARVRIKGDWLDHVASPKWSLRVELEDDALLGMRRFSIQHPNTRGYLSEWLVLAAARREGVLAPRSTFVEVTVNGVAKGVYYLEEHLAKELLESQGRREGPILKLDEGTLWEARLQYLNRGGWETLPELAQRSERPETAELSAFGEGRLEKLDALRAQRASARAALRTLQLAVEAATDDAEQLARLEARVALEGRSIDSLVDVEAWATMHALVSVFHANHGLIWHNLRFYHDPLSARLHPILFDAAAGLWLNPDRPVLRASDPVIAELEKSPAYRLALFQRLGVLLSPEWLDGLLADVGPELQHYQAALRHEGLLPPEKDAAHLIDLVRHQQVLLRSLALPRRAANFHGRLEAEARDDSVVDGDLVVEAWSATEAPVLVEGFRFGNGRIVPAARTLAADSRPIARPHGEAVMLPRGGRRASFRFPADVRLANLSGVDQLVQAVREEAGTDGDADLEVVVLYRPAATRDLRERALRMRRVDASGSGGRPDAPTLDAALERHSFLRFDAERRELWVRPGIWTVDGDLVLPSGHALRAGPGTTLRFAEGAALVASAALHLEGDADRPVALEAAPGQQGWAGVAVLDAAGPSRLAHVVVRDASAIERGGWILTGGVSFVRSELSLIDSRIEGASGEDALNVVGAPFHVERVAFVGTLSDAFDADSADGLVIASAFEDVGADALDLSGSRVRVEDSHFRGIGDKAVSAGERTVLALESSRIDGARIGVASKDGSHVEITSLELSGITRYELTAYVKKPAFGPSVMRAQGLRRLEGEPTAGERFLVQEGCEILVDGRQLPTRPLDVKRLYADGVLGT
jgi:hypothetical protein